MARRSKNGGTKRPGRRVRPTNQQRAEKAQRNRQQLLWGATQFWADVTRKPPVVPFFSSVNPELSNHWEVGKTSNGRRLQFQRQAYLSTEHAYMAAQALHFGRRDLATIWTRGTGTHRVQKRVFDARNPKHIKSWSTIVLGPLKRRRPDLKTTWDAKKGALMYRLNWAKYRQFPALRTRLLATGRAFLVETSPHDDYWGIGTRLSTDELNQGPLGNVKWGRNEMGMILMRVRRQLVGWKNRLTTIKQRAARRAAQRQYNSELARHRRQPVLHDHPVPVEQIQHFAFQLCPLTTRRLGAYNQHRAELRNHLGVEVNVSNCFPEPPTTPLC
jgi:ribA/ribD-fused uncharacterized protein